MALSERPVFGKIKGVFETFRRHPDEEIAYTQDDIARYERIAGGEITPEDVDTYIKNCRRELDAKSMHALSRINFIGDPSLIRLQLQQNQQWEIDFRELPAQDQLSSIQRHAGEQLMIIGRLETQLMSSEKEFPVY